MYAENDFSVYGIGFTSQASIAARRAGFRMSRIVFVRVFDDELYRGDADDDNDEHSCSADKENVDESIESKRATAADFTDNDCHVDTSSTERDNEFLTSTIMSWNLEVRRCSVG